jgi:putative ABC transport system permease protein
VRTFANLQGIAPGFDTTQVLTLRAPNVTNLPPGKARALFDDVTAKLRAFPGVVAVATTSRAPYDAGQVFPLRVKAQDSRFDGTAAPVQMFTLVVSPEYFSTLKIAIVQGRTFGPMDGPTSPQTAVVNATMARLAFGTADPIGRQIDWPDMMGAFTQPRTIVGVVHDVHEIGGSAAVLPTVYESSVQAPPGTVVLIRTTGDPALVGHEASRLIHEVDPKRPVVDVRTLESTVADEIAPSRLNATLFGGFALLALSIAAVGIGGVLAFSVTQRTREFGIRMALGSGRSQILHGVLVEGLTLAGSGLVIGTIAATVLGRFLQKMLFDVGILDVATFIVMGALLAAVAAAASWLPALRATRVDPNVALRAN